MKIATFPVASGLDIFQYAILYLHAIFIFFRLTPSAFDLLSQLRPPHEGPLATAEGSAA
jgi:hypothetical protein